MQIQHKKSSILSSSHINDVDKIANFYIKFPYFSQWSGTYHGTHTMYFVHSYTVDVVLSLSYATEYDFTIQKEYIPSVA